ncbi:serine/threonine-protein kinase [Tahibacter harae]|uniref:Serine/threonine-protein kinase n=1 Tax=Tahibacter harae TaxID=2963937 RepID=A0ABT1QLE1_9GAMM|nr:serine/threonine-protein kinase [Tahibacter harae]MCQ4163351.1 serine/threonine-protein kinase [Tahibacter harae]
MTQQAFQRLRQLFDRLTELPAEQRDDFLAGCAEIGETTRRQLRDLLQADADVGDLTVRPLRSPGEEAAAAWLGRRIGAFEITRVLGQGGMGSVFLANRVAGGVAQQVAIKVVRSDMLDAATRARFRLERQVLALLQHPNIAAMLDLGELEDGSPYAIMEFVDGETITRHAREHNLDLRRRLQLFLEVCNAVAHAHRSMIVHRDIKPGNVLVDREGRPRLLDFGIAKPLSAQLGAVDVEETSAAQRFVSLSHAAPEQLRGEAITTACDVYGLGALLYELLAGVPAFAREGLTPAQLERMICETDPLPPSRRSGAGGVAAIPRDLDLIVLRCLRKQPADRYVSVDQLAGELRDFLAGRPVLARRGNALYRAGRFFARHRLALALGAVILLGGVTGLALLWRQQLATLAQQSRADAMTDLILSALHGGSSDNPGSKDTTAREVFERVASEARARTDLDPVSRARVLGTVARVHLELGLPKEAEAVIAQIDDAALPAEQRDELDLLRVSLLQALNRFDEARAVIAPALARPHDVQARARWDLAQARLDYDEGNSQAALQRIDAMTPAVLSPELREQRLKQRSDTLWVAGKRAEGIADSEQLLALRRARLGEESPAVYSSLRDLASGYLYQGDVARAQQYSDSMLALAGKLFSANSLRYADALSIQRSLEQERGDFEAALVREQRVLAIRRDQLGADGPHVARSYFNLASLYSHSRQLAAAEDYGRRSLEIAERVWLPSDLNVFLFRVVFAATLIDNGKIAEARTVVHKALKDCETYPALQQYDIYPLALAMERLGAYEAVRSEENRLALSKALHEAKQGAADNQTRAYVDTLLAHAAGRGVEPAP